MVKQACPTCVSGKLSEKPFGAKEKRVLKKNQILLAIDYVGPMQVTSRDGFTDMANIVVEPFHLDMVYPLREKSSQAQLDAVKDCVAKMKAHAPTFRVAFIKRTMLQMIVEMARSMMLGANLPTAYWADAVVCAAYVRNRCPTKVLDGMTPMEALFGTAPDISNLRVFGCKVQVLVPKEHRKKLDSKTRNGIFIGYATGGAYLVYIPRHGTGETITARSIVFYGDQFLPSEDGEEITISSQLDLLRLDAASSTPSPRLETLEEEREDVAMVPSEAPTPNGMETPAQPTTGSSQPMGADRLEARLRGDPRREKATAPVRRSSRIPKPSQRKLEYDQSHLSMEEVCAMVEERVLPAAFDGTNVRDGFLYGGLTPSDISSWAPGVEPLNLDEVYESDDQSEWEHAMDDEIKSLLENGTFEVVPLPPGRSAVKSKWVFKKKTLADGSLDKYKARIVAKGYSQKYGEDYTETFSPVVRHSTLRLVLVIVVARRMKRMQQDVKTAFLNSDLDEEIYLEPAEGYQCDDGHVWRLRRALYGLKQASRSWYDNLRVFLESQGFYQGEADYCLFSKGSVDGDDLMLVLVYVDDILAFAAHDKDLLSFKASMEAVYEVNDFENASYFLGLELQWSPSGDECIGINLVLKDLGMEVDQITVFEDNQGAQHLAEGKADTQRSRHIDTNYHWLREKVKEGNVQVSYCPTSEMIADHFTKALGAIKFKHFRDELGVRRVGVLEHDGKLA
ncbi:unnamed protein product [Phytophthora fragariaefolia]|uniref:Unnamed protein product n=1 Tax=Phytophthora fragariaefolia TaxID=1490495 RepID=A0A9W6TQF0_9STRA|nr:unnamed protein product [Phytophthora fragariaefolia]